MITLGFGPGRISYPSPSPFPARSRLLFRELDSECRTAFVRYLRPCTIHPREVPPPPHRSQLQQCLHIPARFVSSSLINLFKPLLFPCFLSVNYHASGVPCTSNRGVVAPVTAVVSLASSRPFHLNATPLKLRRSKGQRAVPQSLTRQCSSCTVAVAVAAALGNMVIGQENRQIPSSNPCRADRSVSGCSICSGSSSCATECTGLSTARCSKILTCFDLSLRMH
jgi:hypothetical protein